MSAQRTQPMHKDDPFTLGCWSDLERMIWAFGCQNEMGKWLGWGKRGSGPGGQISGGFLGTCIQMSNLG